MNNYKKVIIKKTSVGVEHVERINVNYRGKQWLWVFLYNYIICIYYIQIQLWKNTDTAHTHTYTNTAKRRENKEKATLVHSTTAIWLSCSSFVPSRLDFSAGRRVYERARGILSRSHMTAGCVRRTAQCATTYIYVRCRAVCVIYNCIARLPAFAHFPVMAAAAEVWRPGGCRPCHHVRRVVVTCRRQQDIGIHDESRFGKLFLVSNLWWVGWGFFSLVTGIALSVAATGLTGASYGHCCRRTVSWGR